MTIHLFGLDAAAADLRRALVHRDAILRQATAFHLPSALVAAIGSREMHWNEHCAGVTPGHWLGDPEKLQDGSIHFHGCGPLQVDDRTDPIWCAEWKAGKYEVEEGVRRGLQEAIGKLRYFQHHQKALLGSRDLLRCAIAAYNCGEANVHRALLMGNDPDYYTIPHDGRSKVERDPWKPGDYSRDVLERATYFSEHGFASSEGASGWGNT